MTTAPEFLFAITVAGAVIRRETGLGWSTVDPDTRLGTLVLWDLAPEGADARRFECDGMITELPVSDIAYRATWWRVPCPEFAWPTIAGVRIGGRWTRETRRG